MADHPDALVQAESNGLKAELEKARKSLPDFHKRTFNGIKENALIDCLERSVELAESCLKAASATQSACANLLARGLLDSLFLARWILSSDENARRFELHSRNQILQDLKHALLSGPGDHPAQGPQKGMAPALLPLLYYRKNPKKIGAKKIAKDGGLEQVYMGYYGFLLAEFHGGLFDPHSAEDKKWTLLASLAISRAAMAAINSTIAGWITSRKTTSTKEILKTFMLLPEG